MNSLSDCVSADHSEHDTIDTNSEITKVLSDVAEKCESKSDGTNTTRSTGKRKNTGGGGLYAQIKEEFLVEKEKLADVTKTESKVCTDTEQPATKKPKRRGQNKKRAMFYNERPEPKSKLCPAVLRNEPCLYGNNCKYTHDIKKYMESKKADISDFCYNFSHNKKCPYSFSCRYAGAHVVLDDGEYRNVEKNSDFEVKQKEVNKLQSELLTQLRKRSYNFSKADTIVKAVTKEVKIEVELKIAENKPREEATTNSVDVGESQIAISDHSFSNVNDSFDNHAIGPLTDDDQFTIKAGEKKTVDFKNKLYLAPLTTVGNLPFRRICKGFGADITCGEMAMATHLLQGTGSEWALLKRHESEDIFGVQLCGAFASPMARCTQLLCENCDIDFIDINLGCPIDMVFNQGAGSALMRRRNRLQEIVRSMVQVSTVPITVKLRTGISENKNTAHTLIPKLKDWGSAVTTIHGRSREQRYTKFADWQYIEECTFAANPMPLIGGGDILTFEDYNSRIKTNVSSTMIARGALIKPWLFTEIKEQRHWDISSSERLDILRNFANFGLEHWGSDGQGVETTRRFLLEWLSFLYRYIPVGLLEVLPQKINMRPPLYRGRDDLETLMASPNSADWVKISEMLVGPVPDGFFFLPKHKANSYN